jgi:hypothetical protein
MILVKSRLRMVLAAASVAVVVGTAGTIAAVGTGAARASSDAAQPNNTCVAIDSAQAALAAKLTTDIKAALSGRTSIYGLRVEDRVRHIECRFNQDRHFDSASVVKASLLAATLWWRHGALSSLERSEATAMITHSDNNAATFFWNELGHARFQQYLTLAGMPNTIPSPGGTWGLTQLTAQDELQQLRLLIAPNKAPFNVLTDAERNYELNLMANVELDQRWGTPAGAPRLLNVYVKNGWLPRATLGWRINSIGAFFGHGRDYLITMLTDNNPTMPYGVTTIERVAQVVHRDLNAGLPPAGTPLPGTIIVPALQRPDEVLPASAATLP